MLKNEKKDLQAVKEKRPDGFHLEADRFKEGISLSIAGISSILDFSEQRVLVRVKKRRIEIVGTELSVTVYENRIVEITGRISGVSFL